MNRNGYSYGVHAKPTPKPSQEQRIYRLLKELEGELASYLPANCNAAFAAAIMAARHAIKALKVFF